MSDAPISPAEFLALASKFLDEHGTRVADALESLPGNTADAFAELRSACDRTLTALGDSATSTMGIDPA